MHNTYLKTMPPTVFREERSFARTWQARCTCGYVGSERASFSEANLEMVRHAASHDD